MNAFSAAVGAAPLCHSGTWCVIPVHLLDPFFMQQLALKLKAPSLLDAARTNNQYYKQVVIVDLSCADVP
jgi:hypothetical protein